jgi:hypothetical protein
MLLRLPLGQAEAMPTSDCTQAAAPEPVPHAGYHFDGSRRRFFEGWYWKLTDPASGDSFALIYSIEDPPGGTEHAGVRPNCHISWLPSCISVLCPWLSASHTRTTSSLCALGSLPGGQLCAAMPWGGSPPPTLCDPVALSGPAPCRCASCHMIHVSTDSAPVPLCPSAPLFLCAPARPA